jgi:CheY-like chemotaxis protein
MPKILIFDRDARSRELYRKEFQGEGFDVLTASSLRDALRSFRTERPALVLFSIESTGAELLGTIEQMVSANRRVPIIFAGQVTKNADPGCVRSEILSLEEGSGLCALKQAVRELCPFPATLLISSARSDDSTRGTQGG